MTDRDPGPFLLGYIDLLSTWHNSPRLGAFVYGFTLICPGFGLAFWASDLQLRFRVLAGIVGAIGALVILSGPLALRRARLHGGRHKGSSPR